MKNSSRCAENLAALLKTLPEVSTPELPDSGDPVAVLILSFLMWECNTTDAVAAYERLIDQVVDFNDLRACMPNETAEYLGEGYPLAGERCRRLRAALRSIFLREHAVSLDRLLGAGKREVKKDVESLDGMVPYVSSRVMLLAFDAHAVPADELLRELLIEAGAAEPDADVVELSSWLGRNIKASDSRAAHFKLQAWVDEKMRKTSADKVDSVRAAETDTDQDEASTASAPQETA